MFYGQVEGSGYEHLDPRFRECVIGSARLERLWTGARWTEGAVYFQANNWWQITYVGGDGNDVVLTTVAAPLQAPGEPIPGPAPLALALAVAAIIALARRRLMP